MPPTLASIDMLLSFSIMSKLFGCVQTLFRPSKAKPPVIEPSPMIATTCCSCSSFSVAATAIPSAAEIDVEAWPAIKVSYSLSSGFVNPEMPPNLRLVWNRSLLPVSIL